jgi:hypothetical protein
MSRALLPLCEVSVAAVLFDLASTLSISSPGAVLELTFRYLLVIYFLVCC